MHRKLQTIPEEIEQLIARGIVCIFSINIFEKKIKLKLPPFTSYELVFTSYGVTIHSGTDVLTITNISLQLIHGLHSVAL